jgi:surfeit locus 1 family protein
MTPCLAWTFRPRFVTTAAAVAFCVLSVSLGNWQSRRAAEKETEQAQRDARAGDVPMMIPGRPIDAEAWRGRRVIVRGEFASPYGILVDNRTRAGRAGFEVEMPVRIAGSDLHVLVNRGWVAQGRTREELPAPHVPAGPVWLEGIAVVPPARVFELGDPAPTGRVWQHLDLARYRSWSGLSLQPIVVRQTSKLNDGQQDDGLLRRWPDPDSDAGKHSAYALQWYIFALLTAILYVALNLKRAGTGRKR